MFNGSPSLADIAAVTGRNNGDGNGFGEGWWVIVLILAIFGWGNGGFGYGNGGGNGYTQELQRGFDTQTIIGSLRGIENGLCSLGYDQLNQMNGINTNIMQTGFGLQGALNNLSQQLSDCCCENRVGQMNIVNQMDRNSCATVNAINQAAQSIMQNDNANYQRLHDEQVQLLLAQKDEKIAELTACNQAKDLRASQLDQTADIVNQVITQLSKCPVGTYNVCNPATSNLVQQIANLVGRNGGCDCGNGFGFNFG